MASKTFAETVSAFGAAAKAKLSNPAITGAPEDQLRNPLETVLRDLAELGGMPPTAVQLVGETTVKHLKSRPDFAVTVRKALVGFIEVKAPGKGAGPRKLIRPVSKRKAVPKTMDTRTPEQRSRIMKSVGTKHTGPELIVRKVLHALGCRYALHRKDLPGSPDIVMPSRKKVVFVHGCFWHAHSCRYGRLPKSHADYWRSKILANSSRDRRNQASLIRAGWSVLVVWQCQTKDSKLLAGKLSRFVQS